MELDYNLRQAVETLRSAHLDTDHGMPLELFLTVSSLVPIVNVDLLIVNEKNQLLLSRRNDEFFEKSWHIPGGCLRYGEELIDRVQKTAEIELGSLVLTDHEPIAVRNVIRGENLQLPYPRERGHNVAILYRCRLPSDYRIDNGNKTENDHGYLRWFSVLPEDFMKIQNVYKDILSPWRKEG